MNAPRLKVGDEFWTRNELRIVTDEPLWQDSSQGEQWWYPSKPVGGMLNIKESDIDFEEAE